MITIFPFQGIIAGEKRQDESPNFYLYEVETTDQKYRGLVGSVTLESVENGAILPHENVFSDRRSSLHETFSNEPVQHNPILLITDEQAFREKKKMLFQEIELVEERKECNGNIHRLFRSRVKYPPFFLHRPLCIADGHHRIASLLDYHRSRKGCLKSSRVMIAISSTENVRNRGKGIVVNLQDSNLNPFIMKGTPHHILRKLGVYFNLVETSDLSSLNSPLEFSMFYNGHWHRLTLKPFWYRENEHSHLLSIEIFKEFVIKRVFGMNCYSENKFVDVVLKCCPVMIKDQVKSQDQIGFIIPPDPSNKIIDAAKQKRILEACSTYFEPKFLHGMICRQL